MKKNIKKSTNSHDEDLEIEKLIEENEARANAIKKMIKKLNEKSK